MSQKSILMIPGPVEFHEDVLACMAEATPSHVAPPFREAFGRLLGNLRHVFLSPAGQPFVLAGSGSLGWDMIAANLVEPGEHAVVVNTGYFADSFGECLETYGAVVTHVRAPSIGATVSEEALAQALTAAAAAGPVKLVTITMVDTSTAVLTDVKALAATVARVAPDALIAVDGVCAFGGEEFRFDAWGIDAAMTGSQKALGAPPGLMVAMLSPRALAVRAARKSPARSYYANVASWLPIMKAYEARQPCYFATPAVNLVKALDVAVGRLLAYPGGMDGVFEAHRAAASSFKAAVAAMGLAEVPASRACAANLLSAIKLPAGVDQAKLLAAVGEQGVVIAGGLHRETKATYFRVGHMGVSVLEPARGHLPRVLAALRVALEKCGHVVPQAASL